MSALDDAIKILNLVNGLAPVGVRLITSLLEKLQGKSEEEILAQADSTWNQVIETARKELGQ